MSFFRKPVAVPRPAGAANLVADRRRHVARRPTPARVAAPFLLRGGGRQAAARPWPGAAGPRPVARWYGSRRSSPDLDRRLSLGA